MIEEVTAPFSLPNKNTLSLKMCDTDEHTAEQQQQIYSAGN